MWRYLSAVFLSIPMVAASALTLMSAAVRTDPIPTGSRPILERYWTVPRVSENVFPHREQRHLRWPCSVPHLSRYPESLHSGHTCLGFASPRLRLDRNAIAERLLEPHERPIGDTSPGALGRGHREVSLNRSFCPRPRATV